MPCYDHRNSGDFIRAEMQQEVDQLARWLCSILTTIESSGIQIEIKDRELKSWWETHKAWDKARKESK